MLNKIPLVSIHKILNASGIHNYYEDMLRPFRDNAIIPNNFEEIIDLLNSNEIKNPDLSIETSTALKNYYDIDTQNKTENGKEALSRIIRYVNSVEISNPNLFKKISTIAVYYFVNFIEYIKIILKKNIITSNFNFNFLHNQKDQFAKKLSDLDDRL